MENNIQITPLSQLSEYSKKIAAQVSASHFSLILLEGTLGSGKTTFTQNLGHHLGIEEDIQSPTYALLREYDVTQPAGLFIHMDLYRLSSFEEIEQYGILDLFSRRQGIFCIEWPALLKEWLHTIFPDDILTLSFSIADDGTTRHITENRG